MREPRLRTVNKAVAPFDLNKFPSKFIDTLAKEIVYMQATKSSMSLEGNEWEQIFAECVGAEWKPSNVGLDDVVLDNCCWGAKTVFGATNIEKQKTVRLISGRNSPTYSYGVDSITSENPNEIGKLVLDIWNERVSAVRQIYKFVRTVVLVKSKDYKDFLVFEFDTIRYDPELLRAADCSPNIRQLQSDCYHPKQSQYPLSIPCFPLCLKTNPKKALKYWHFYLPAHL